MNENPWHVDNMARMQRERVQEEMRQIRLEEKALKAEAKGPPLLRQAWALARRWLEAGETRTAPTLERQPLTETHAKRQAGIQPASIKRGHP